MRMIGEAESVAVALAPGLANATPSTTVRQAAATPRHPAILAPGHVSLTSHPLSFN
eukprot:m.85667 g.85667  ORF g.85667 m.85667 type:complete len:56 (+) comp11403_c0_seq1:1427-1594(+)